MRRGKTTTTLGGRERLYPNGDIAVTPARDSGGGTALHVAAERGDQEMMILLIGEGAEMSAVDRLGRTPLHCSSQLGYGEATKLLVDGGALISTVNGAGRTARDLGEEKRMERAIKALDGEPSTGVYEDRLITLDRNFTKANQLFSGLHCPVLFPIQNKESVHTNKKAHTWPATGDSYK